MLYNRKMIYPCIFESMKGTSWYNRLIAAEFDIRLDKYPGQETLIDNIIPSESRWGSKWEAYREVLLTLYSEEKKERLSPWDFIARFRGARNRIFPELKRGMSVQPDSGSSNSSFTGIPGEELIKRTGDRDILFIPGGREKAAAEIREMALLYSEEKLTVLVSEDPVLDLPSPSEMRKVFPGMKLFSIQGMDQAAVLKNRADVIICSHGWIMFALAEAGIEGFYLLDEKEWFHRNILKTALSSSAGIGCPEGSMYSLLLETEEQQNPALKPIFTLSALESRFSESPVHPRLRTAGDRAPWLKRAEEQSPIHYHEQFLAKRENRWIPCKAYDQDSVHITVLKVPEREAEIQPRFFSAMLSPLQLKTEKLSYTTSFNYYFTDNLRYRHENSGGSCGKWNNFLLDYLGFRSGPEYCETLPLYNKALLGCTETGELKAFHSPEFSVSWQCDGAPGPMIKPEVNPADNPSEALYTPGSGLLRVGEDRACAVICHDTVLEYRQGPVPIPPFGAVLVTEKELQAGQRIKWKVGFPACKDIRWNWLFGGFNMLVENGVSLMSRESPKILEQEGWMLPLSTETQETQLAPDTRHPRSVLGKTESGMILQIVISGRSRLSRGATFKEAAEIAMETAGEAPLEFLINLDGGASASLCAVSGDKHELLSYPAPSDSNPVQVPRPVPGLLCLSAKRDVQKC